MGAFPPPVKKAGDTCYITDHVDIGIGINAASPNKEAAKTFVEWVGTTEFAELYGNALPGFFSLSKEPITIENPLAQEFVAWRGECEATIRLPYQILQPRHAQPRERPVGGLGQRDQRHRRRRRTRRPSCRRASPPGTRRNRSELPGPAGRSRPVPGLTRSQG